VKKWCYSIPIFYRNINTKASPLSRVGCDGKLTLQWPKSEIRLKIRIPISTVQNCLYVISVYTSVIQIIAPEPHNTVCH